MQSCTVICVGKLSADYFAKGCAEYTKRLSAFCDLKVVELAEEKIDEKHASAQMIEKALERESIKILEAVPKTTRLIALCVEGKAVSSEQLAEMMNAAALLGTGGITFAIGSSHGLHEKVKQAAHIKLSISPMTFPHQLCRLILFEQIYRAYSINAGTKYHK